MMRHLSLKERAYNIIKSKILNGEFELGSRIREDILAEEISMSRTPVREAINQLTAEGLLKNIPRRGIFSIELTEKEINDMLELRTVLEYLAVDHFIDKMEEIYIQILENNITEFKEALKKEDFIRCNELDSRFHQEIANVTGNSKLIKFLSEIEDFMRIARNVEKKVMPKDKNEITLKEHMKIFDALKKRDRDAAKREIKDNIETMKKNLGIIKDS